MVKLIEQFAEDQFKREFDRFDEATGVTVVVLVRENCYAEIDTVLLDNVSDETCRWVVDGA